MAEYAMRVPSGDQYGYAPSGIDERESRAVGADDEDPRGASYPPPNASRCPSGDQARL